MDISFEAFRKMHPSGSIGISLLKAKEISQRKKDLVPLVSKEHENERSGFRDFKKGGLV